MLLRGRKVQLVLPELQDQKENKVYQEQSVLPELQDQKENEVKLVHKAHLVRRVRQVRAEYVVVHPPVILRGF
jgi:hypothetical protein